MKKGQHISRRDFVGAGVAATGAAAFGMTPAANPALESKILSFNPQMEYRRLGKTGLMVSVVGLGGHWKRVQTVVGGGPRYTVDSADFMKNRADVVDRCIELGINHLDTVDGNEVLVYAKLLKGERHKKMYFGWGWPQKEPRVPQFTKAKALMKGLDESLQQTGLEYIDWWRLTAYEYGGEHTFHETEEMIAALDQAKRQGKARFTGITSHDHAWLKMMIEQYPAQLDVVLFPYTSDSKVLPQDSLFDTLRKYDVGMLGIKPFGSNSLFKGDGSPGSPFAEEDSKLARLAVRYILMNPAITAPIPGMITVAQVDNMAKAVKERRELDMKESADLRQANREMWARLPENYQWLKKWEYV
jgi:aryl-alcohol dehydrogenase-like predicted oxidoreductase